MTLTRFSPSTVDPAAAVPTRAGAVRGSWSGRIIVWLAIGWVALVLLAALLADVLPLHRYDQIVPDLGPRVAPNFDFPEPLGTDAIGRSVLSRLVFGARQSLVTGVCSVGVALVVGVGLGLLGGYLRGRVDAAIGVVLDSVLSLPALVVLLAVVGVGRRDTLTLVLGLSVVTAPTFARLARAGTIALAERPYVIVARTMGAGVGRILLREILPDVLLRVSSYVFLMLAAVIVAEGSLSFLGLGIPPPTPSWGGMINDGRSFVDRAPALVFVPSLCLLLTVMALSAIGDRLRRRYDRAGSALR